MRVLILANNDIGLYNFRKELIQELIKQGDEVILSLPYGSRVDDFIKMGCRYIKTEFERRSMNILKDIGLMKQYLLTIRKEKPDYILTYTIKPNIYGGITARFSGIKYISTITGLGTTFQKKGFVRFLITKLYRAAMKKAQHVIFENEENKSIFIRDGIIPEDQAIVVKGAGVNLDEFSFTPMAFSGPTRFLFIGRIMEEKGVNELFEAACRIKESFHSNVEFDFLGFFEDNYEHRVKELERTGVIRYYGFQKDVKNYIKNAHCVILPSYHEGMSNTLLESAAMGRPLITSDIPGCREAVIDGKTGYLCKVRDAEDLRHKIQMFLELSREDRAMMGMESRSHIEHLFDRKEVVKTIIKLMEKDT